MAPDVSLHDPRPHYLRELLTRSGLSQREAAQRLGMSDRVMRYYLSDPKSSSYREAPYAVQYAMEALAQHARRPAECELTDRLRDVLKSRFVESAGEAVGVIEDAIAVIEGGEVAYAALVEKNADLRERIATLETQVQMRQRP